MIKPAKFLLPLAIVLFGPSLSRADLSITLGNNPQPGEENVLLNTGTTGNTVLGTLNQSGFLVNFASTQVLTEPSNGQARIEATNNSSQVPVTDISFSLANGTFTDAIFNPFIGGIIGSPGDATITVVGKDAMANPETFTGTFSLGNGQNFFTVVASNGESLTVSACRPSAASASLIFARSELAEQPSRPCRRLAQHCPCSVPVFWLSRYCDANWFA